MADDPVKLREWRWKPLLEYAQRPDAIGVELGTRLLPAPNQITVRVEIEIGNVLYLPATYTLDERDTRA